MLRSLLLSIFVLGLGHGAAFAQKTAPAWRWSDAPDLYPMVELRAKERHNVYTLREVVVNKTESRAELRRELSKGGVSRVVWQTTIADKKWSDLVGAAMVVAGDTVYVARYNRIATGCNLRAFAIADGTERWSIQLHGIGPVSHSKWFNRVQLGARNGNPVAFGNEGPTRGYVEVRDAASGKLLANRTLKLPGRPHVLAEPLYRELANMLRTGKRYTVSPSAFAGRHNMTFKSASARVRAFRKAVAELDGLPVGGGHTMRVRLVRDPNGGYLLEARR